MVVFSVVECAGWGKCEIHGEIAALAVADAGLPLGKLTAVCVESDRTLRVVILEPFGLGEAEADLGRRCVGGMLLHFFVTDKGDFIHMLNFIIISYF